MNVVIYQFLIPKIQNAESECARYPVISQDAARVLILYEINYISHDVKALRYIEILLIPADLMICFNFATNFFDSGVLLSCQNM